VSEANKRLSPRIPASIEARIWTGGRAVKGQIRTINLSGFFVSLDTPLPVGELLRMTLQLPDRIGVPFECTGWVRSCNVDTIGGAGVKLFGLSKVATDRWAAHYQRTRQQLASRPARVLVRQQPPLDQRAAP
jgi:hypothetical protein